MVVLVSGSITCVQAMPAGLTRKEAPAMVSRASD